MYIMTVVDKEVCTPCRVAQVCFEWGADSACLFFSSSLAWRVACPSPRRSPRLASSPFLLIWATLES
jgi:hypothetical protein